MHLHINSNETKDQVSNVEKKVQHNNILSQKIVNSGKRPPCTFWLIYCPLQYILSTCLNENTVNPFSINVLLLYPLRPSENPWFSDVFRGFRNGTLVENGLILFRFCCFKGNQLWRGIYQHKNKLKRNKIR